MLPVLSVQNMRESDAATIAAGTPGAELMRRAGEGLLHAADWQGPVAIVCGTGNNAGDGYVLATLLQEQGIVCDLLLKEKKFTPDGQYWFDRCTSAGVPVRLFEQVDSLAGYRMIADCLFGTGYRDRPAATAADPFRRMIDLINASGAFVVSTDINSGLNGDSGLGRHAVKSDLTVAIGGFKPGHFLNQAADTMRRKVNCDIGITPVHRIYQLMEQADVAPLFAPRPHFSNKGNYGPVALVGGSLPYPGAIRLAAMAEAALRSGAGVVRIAAPEGLCPLLVPRILESTLYPLPEEEGHLRCEEEAFSALIRGMKVIAFGMGVGNTAETRKTLRFLLSAYQGVLILDADGLNALAALTDSEPDALRSAACRVIITPHPGEFARLIKKSIPEVQECSIPLAEAYAADQRITVLLKGPSTVVTDGRETLLVDRGCPGMATGGSGDVLSGILAAVCASHPGSLLRATAAAAWLNGRAGELAQKVVGDIAMVASDTVQHLSQALRELRD